MPRAVRLSQMERKAIEVIRKAGEKGILQSELWKILGTDSREGSRIAIRLEKKGLINREPAVYAGKRTFKLTLIKREGRKVSIENVKGCPCFTCPNLTRCGEGQNITPIKCEKLTDWIMKNIMERGK
ncbi:MAG: hypothetical protein NDF53_03080 [archaeon GB-1867-097]|nr:hypothetical protein [Candidatus Verstraetearchaeota archaeon]MCS7373375.1 hypothetical protein [Candidatus Culexmicrobium thermophilum]MCS7384698.1 hypothetical protein [Candidatus Culexmicrobium thermophilum]RLE55930.1 MAG: hypothetical protein DRJ30_03000 [Candidatus Verstraetearchaeota archaeon]HDO20603.1 hypothetical protein [Candidatus Bathyarchaeota archaeon]